jgi:hypothetical protein
MSAANNHRRQVLNPCVIGDGSIDRLKDLKIILKFIIYKLVQGTYLTYNFQSAYFERLTDCYVDFLDEVPSSSKIKKDVRALYGTFLNACQGVYDARY